MSTQVQKPGQKFSLKTAFLDTLSRDALDQHIFSVDHEYFIDQCLVRFCRTAHVTSKHISLTS
jgi:hypothetical protein